MPQCGEIQNLRLNIQELEEVMHYFVHYFFKNVIAALPLCRFLRFKEQTKNSSSQAEYECMMLATASEWRYTSCSLWKLSMTFVVGLLPLPFIVAVSFKIRISLSMFIFFKYSSVSYGIMDHMMII